MLSTADRIRPTVVWWTLKVRPMVLGGIPDSYRARIVGTKTGAFKAIPLGKLRHSNISRMRAAGIAADVVAAWHGHTERMTTGRLRAGDRRPAHRRVGGVLVGR